MSSDFRVKNKNHSGSNSTKSIGTGSLEKSTGSLVGDDLPEAVTGTLVDPVFLGLLRLHLQTTTDSVHGVRSVSSRDRRELGTSELGGSTDETILLKLVRVVSRKSIEESEVDSTVRDDSGNGNSNTIVKSTNTRRLDGLGKTVDKTVELLLSGTDIGSKTGTGVIKRVDNQKGSGSGKTSRGHVDQEELSEFGVLVGRGESGLDGILEGEVEGLGGEITDDVCHVSTPESANSLFGGDTREAVNNTGVSRDLSTDNLGVSILGLDKELDTLDGSSHGLGDGTGDTTGQEVDHKVRHFEIFEYYAKLKREARSN
jgi:hypothetical protein